jgi:hypothetical protein
MKKKPLIIAGISLAVLGLGYFAYRYISLRNKEVIKGKHNTIIVDTKEDSGEIESVGWDEPTETQPVENNQSQDLNQQLFEWERYNLS